MRVLLLGSGGREHALARALSADPDVTDLHAAPGNPGIAELAPPAPGGPHRQRAGGRPGPGYRRRPGRGRPGGTAGRRGGRRAARVGHPVLRAQPPGRGHRGLQIVRQAGHAARPGSPPPRRTPARASEQADAALAEFGPPYVVKADGLAAGKGVVVTSDLAAARAHAEACGTVVIEEFLDGPEVSLFALADGVTAVPLLAAQDFKRAGDGDQGPNTGGMGAYAPLPWAPPGLADEVLATVIQPAVDELRRRGTPYRGPAVRGAEPDRGGAAGGGVQRPVRRPGDPGRAGPAGRRRWPGCWPRRRPAPWRARRRCAGRAGPR